MPAKDFILIKYCDCNATNAKTFLNLSPKSYKTECDKLVTKQQETTRSNNKKSKYGAPFVYSNLCNVFLHI